MRYVTHKAMCDAILLRPLDRMDSDVSHFYILRFQACEIKIILKAISNSPGGAKKMCIIIIIVNNNNGRVVEAWRSRQIDDDHDKRCKKSF